jgi:hypothetical protein
MAQNIKNFKKDKKKNVAHKNISEIDLLLPQDLVMSFLDDCYHLSYLLLARQS